MAEYEPETKKDFNAVKRYTHRARYDEATIHKILDEGLLAFPFPIECYVQYPAQIRIHLGLHCIEAH